MTQLTRQDLHAQVELRFPDNTTSKITPAIVRAFLHEYIESAYLPASDDQTTLNVPPYAAGQFYGQGYLVRYRMPASAEAFFYSLKVGVLPAPTGRVSDPNWRLMSVDAYTKAETGLFVAAQLNAAIAGLVDGAPDALDTLKELAAQLASDEKGAAAMLATLQQHTQQLVTTPSDSVVVHKAGAETITGAKTYTAPITITSFQAGGVDFGLVTVRLDNTFGLNGMLITNAGIGLADIGFAVPNGQKFLHRYESRSEFILSAANTRGEFQFIAPAATGQTLGSKVTCFFSVGEKTALFRNGAKVGINTDTPTEQLEVSGTVKATKFVGDGSGLTNVPGATSSYTNEQARSAQLNRVAPAGTTTVTLTSESPRDYGTASSGTFTVDATDAVQDAGASFRLGAGAGAPAFVNAPQGKPFVFVGVAYAANTNLGYSIQVLADAIQVVIYARS